MMLGVAQLLLARHEGEALKFIGAALVTIFIHLALAVRIKTTRDSLISLAIFLLPSAFVGVFAAVTMPMESSVEEYREIELGLRYAKDADNRLVIKAAIEEAMAEGRLSKWDGTRIRNIIFERNRFLLRSDPSVSQKQARDNLVSAIRSK